MISLPVFTPDATLIGYQRSPVVVVLFSSPGGALITTGDPGLGA